jgi:hypothetical protein
VVLAAGYESKAGVKVVQSLLYGDSPITETTRRGFGSKSAERRLFTT